MLRASLFRFFFFLFLFLLFNEIAVARPSVVIPTAEIICVRLTLVARSAIQVTALGDITLLGVTSPSAEATTLTFAAASAIKVDAPQKARTTI